MPQQQLTRRNGRPQACEPCRKAKIRCDHGLPLCSRCKRHGFNCTYHPAPMTGARAPPKKSKPTTRAIKTPAAIALTLSPSNSASLASDSAGSSRYGVFRRPVSTYGTTKFNAVFAENQESFKDAFSHAAVVIDKSNAFLPLPSDGRDLHGTFSAPAGKMARGIQLLRQFPTPRTAETLCDHLKYIADVWVSPQMIHSCLSQVWQEYGSLLEEPRTEEKMTQVALDLFMKSKQPLSLDKSDQWQNWFCGSELRWEMLGMLFSVFALMFVSLAEYDQVFLLPEQEGRNRNEAARKMAESAHGCAKLCEELGDSEIVMTLSKNAWKTESIVIGDESDYIRKGSAIVMSMFMTLGLHRLPDSVEITPLSEYQTSLAASLYFLDQTESIFNARPPHFTRHYSTWKMPLDLSEADLFGGPERLASAISRLDANGWNTDGQLYATTLLRARCTLTRFWEELLEMTLGVNPKVSLEHINDLLLEVYKIETSWPPQLQFSTFQESLYPKDEWSAIYEYQCIRLHLDVLRCRFLLERLKFSRYRTSAQPLVDLSQTIITLVLSLWLKRDRWPHYTHAFDWMIVCYGIPCAGVLCVELLKSVKAPRDASSVIFSKSEVIRNLNLFVSYLDWIRPTDGNHDLCKKLMRVVQRILETVLEAPSAPQFQSDLQTPPELPDFDGNNTNDLDPSFILFDGMDDLTWLNTVDWTQGDLIGLNQPPQSLL